MAISSTISACASSGCQGTLNSIGARPGVGRLRTPIPRRAAGAPARRREVPPPPPDPRSEEHTSELQSHSDLVCRLLLEKKKTETLHYSTLPSRRSGRPDTIAVPRHH